jgi:hypothetical protein
MLYRTAGTLVLLLMRGCCSMKRRAVKLMVIYYGKHVDYGASLHTSTIRDISLQTGQNKVVASGTDPEYMIVLCWGVLMLTFAGTIVAAIAQRLQAACLLAIEAAHEKTHKDTADNFLCIR